jgi:hypothetical protein
MGALIRIGIVCSAVAWAAVAQAAPAKDSARLAQAKRLAGTGQYDQALATIEEGLATNPKDTDLLELKGQVLVKLPDYLGALEAYEADVAAGAKGPNLRNAKIQITTLGPVRTTFLDIAVTNGPAVIHLDSRTQRAFCTAAPTCRHGWLPGTYKVIADRPGFQPWTGRVTLTAGKTAKLEINLVEKPSLLTVRVAQADATITVDDTAYTAPVTVPAGPHRVAVALSGHVPWSTEVVASEGKPIELDISLSPRVPIRIEPATAVTTLLLDDKPVTVEDGSLGVPAGPHVLVARTSGFPDRRVEIPAERPADYTIVVAFRAPPPARQASPFTPRRKIALAVGGLSLVAVAGGAVLGMQAKQREDDAFALCPSPETPCAAAAEANDLNKQGRSRALQANIAYGVAAGAAVTAAVLWLTGRASESPEPRVAVTPRLGTDAGLDVSLRF